MTQQQCPDRGVLAPCPEQAEWEAMRSELRDLRNRAHEAEHIAIDLERAKADLRSQREAGQALWAKLGGAEAEREKLRAELGRVQPDVARLQSELDGIQAELAELQAEFGRVQAEFDRTLPELERLRAELGAVYTSSSWLLSRPIRAVRRPLRTLRIMLGRG